jgi:hypothetical protein
VKLKHWGYRGGLFLGMFSITATYAVLESTNQILVVFCAVVASSLAVIESYLQVMMGDDDGG